MLLRRQGLQPFAGLAGAQERALLHAALPELFGRMVESAFVLLHEREARAFQYPRHAACRQGDAAETSDRIDAGFEISRQVLVSQQQYVGIAAMRQPAGRVTKP